jgi:thiopeptide-type bacteriocin biosynthesis protein
LQAEGQCPLKVLEETYAHELIIPCLGTPTNHTTSVWKEKAIPAKKYSLGSKWLYLKVYCSISVAERIIAILLPSALEEMEKEQLINSWFFIRYYDTGHHLRLRFHTTFPEAWHKVICILNAVLDPLLNEGLIDTLQTDTYVPEINRYGACLDVVENIFYADSIAITNSLKIIAELNNEQMRWQFALKSVDALLNDLGFSLTEKNELLKVMQISFFNEFGGSLSLQRSLNAKYRADTESINAALESPLQGLFDFSINKRSLMIAKIVPILKIANTTKQNYYTLVSDIIHMSLNRLFPAEQRNHELVVYHYLQKYYTSKQARVMKHEMAGERIANKLKQEF